SGHSISITIPGGGDMYPDYGMPPPGMNPSHSFTFPSDLPGDSANRHFLIATQAFANLGVVAPDYVLPSGFLFLPHSLTNYAGSDSRACTSLSVDGIHALSRNGGVVVNAPVNFAGKAGSIGAAAAVAVALENPQPGSFQSGIGLLSGWSCQGPTITVAI